MAKLPLCVGLSENTCMHLRHTDRTIAKCPRDLTRDRPCTSKIRASHARNTSSDVSCSSSHLSSRVHYLDLSVRLWDDGRCGCYGSASRSLGDRRLLLGLLLFLDSFGEDDEA